MKTRLATILSRLEAHYGKAASPRRADPFEMIVHRNCGYPQSEDRCDRGFVALAQTVGVSPAKILAATTAKLAAAMRAGGMMPELRARRLKEIAARVLREHGGDLRAVLDRPLAEAKKALKKFPTLGAPGVEKILLFAKAAPIAALPSNTLHVLPRLGFGVEKKSYDATYRSAQEAVSAELPQTYPARIRMHLLIKRHGQELCKRSRPKCDLCPVSALCPYAQRARTR